MKFQGNPDNLSHIYIYNHIQDMCLRMGFNQFDVLLGKIGLGQNTVYHRHHHLPVVIMGVVKKPSIFINQPMGIWDIYGFNHL